MEGVEWRLQADIRKVQRTIHFASHEAHLAGEERRRTVKKHNGRNDRALVRIQQLRPPQLKTTGPSFPTLVWGNWTSPC